MSINAIMDALKSLAQSLQIASMFPATLFVLANVYLLLPASPLKLDPNSPNAGAVVLALSLMLSYTLYAFNFPLIRVFEGYKFEGNPIRDWLAYIHRGRHRLIRTEIVRRQLQLHDVERWPKYLSVLVAERIQYELANSQYEFDRDYPADERAVLPTELGNTIAAFEDYPRTRYGMDSIALWPRMLPMLKEVGYMEFVTQEKATFDFLLNTGFMLGLLGIEVMFFALYTHQFLVALWAFIATAASSLIFYEGMIRAARQWGSAIRTAFDLYRYELHNRLGLRAVKGETFEQERDRWQKASRFYAIRPDPEVPLNIFLSQLESLSKSKKTPEGPHG
jgi:hypothetical protein